MAKQRGIHQISGKINNLCYYEQKYVRGGLIRRINEAMSERLKSDPLFAKTRIANTIFGGCSIVASTLLSFFGSRNTYLFKPNRQALLTRAIRKYFLKDNFSSNYPIILDRDLAFSLLPNIIGSIVKNSIFNEFLELARRYSNLPVETTREFTFYRESLVRFCQKYKCIGVQVSISRAHYMYPVNYDSSSGGYLAPDNNAGGRGSYVNWYLSEGESNVILDTDTGDLDDAITFWLVYAIPIRSKYQNRPVLGETGASCGLISFKAY